MAEPGTRADASSRCCRACAHLSGEKLQWYLASELRDRIRQSGADIRIDRPADAERRSTSSRAVFRPTPAPLPESETRLGDVYIELYLTEPSASSQVGLYRSGTRVLEQSDRDRRVRSARRGRSGYVQGIVDAPFLEPHPGTRRASFTTQRFAAFCESLATAARTSSTKIVEEQKHAEEERTNRQTLRSIQKAFREALLVLPEEEYDWFERRASSGEAPRSRRTGLPRPGDRRRRAAADSSDRRD